MKNALLYILLILAAVSCAGNVSVRDFGAKGDGMTPDTEAIQAAIDHAAGKGGGVVRVPAGTYLCGSIWLRSNIELRLESGSIIKGSPDINDTSDCPSSRPSRRTVNHPVHQCAF